MSRTRVKICGITRKQDAVAAIAAGADAIGLVFYERSPRAVSVEQAVEICSDLPPFVSIVALTVNADQALLEQIIHQLPVSLLQFHGDETPELCESYNRPYIKAVRMKPGVDVVDQLQRYSGASALLLDAYRKGVPGGTGESFDWDRIPQRIAQQLILAGGLHPGNIAAAIECVHPFAVDVSGGVEAAPGMKDSEKVREFIANVNRADQVGRSSE